MKTKVESGDLSTMSSGEFTCSYIPKRLPSQVFRGNDFIKGRSHSEAIEAAIASAETSGPPLTLVLDKQN